jgi:hypothetical protein
MFKRILTLAVASVAVIALAATPAQAVSRCPYTTICWYDSSDWRDPKYVVNPAGLPQHTCFNMGVDPNTGINWDRRVDSVWWNDILGPITYVEFYSGRDCTVALVTRAYAWVPQSDQMQSCTEPIAQWNGPCGIPSASKVIRSWAFAR